MVAAQARASGAHWPYVVAAVLLLIFAGGSWVISPQFVFGERHAERPIWTFLTLYGIGWTGFAIAALALRRSIPVPLILVITVAVITRGLLLESNLVQASDVYRYVLDGQAVVNGVNPYRYAPAEVADMAPEALRSQLHTEEGSRILARVSYPEIRTIYPPLAQAAFAAGARLTPWDWFGQRLVFTFFDLATIGLLIPLLTQLQLPKSWVLLYAWNPLVLKEVANSAHLDSLVALCVIAAIYAATRGEADDTMRWPALSGIALSGAVLCKLYPLVLVPAFAAFWFARPSRFRSLFAFATVFVASFLVAYAPFMSVGLETLTEGLRRYTSEWRRNEGLFALVASATPEHARTIANAIVVLGAMATAAWMYRSKSSPPTLIAVVQYTLLLWFMLLPSPYPWYATALLSVCVLRPRSWAVVLSGVLAVYYYSFVHEYRGHPDIWLTVSQGVEHGVILVAIAASLAAKLAGKNDPQAAGA